MRLNGSGSFNSALEEPSIRIKFNDEIDPSEATPDKIDIQPPIKDAKLLASRDEVKVTGTFDTNQHYRVTISTAPQRRARLRSGQGIALGRDFHPEAGLHSVSGVPGFSARRDKSCGFPFSNQYAGGDMETGAYPAGETASGNLARARLRKNARDPVTGQSVVDPRTGFNKQFQTELLVDAFNLPVIATGTAEAASGDASVKRDIRCAAPKGEALSGAYLLEASTALSDGRIVGNRSIICASDFILTQNERQPR